MFRAVAGVPVEINNSTRRHSAGWVAKGVPGDRGVPMGGVAVAATTVSVLRGSGIDEY